MKNEQIKAWASLSWPNRISLARLMFIPPFVILIMNHQEWGPAARYGALAIFAVMAISDAVDGFLARRLGQRSRLGAILDPLADKSLIIWSVILLSLEGAAVRGAQISNWVVVAVVGKDLYVMTGFVVVYLVTDRILAAPTFAGKASTFAQLVMVLAVLVAPELNWILDDSGTWIAMGLSWAVVALAVLAVVSYTRLGIQFVATKQKPLERHPPSSNERDT